MGDKASKSRQRGEKLNLASQIKAAKDVVSKTVEGEEVLLNLSSGKYFGLDQIGTEIWEGIRQGSTAGSILQEIVKNYDVKSDRAEKDLVELLTRLNENGLIAVS